MRAAPEPRRVDRQARGGQQRADPSRIGARQPADARGQLGGEHEPGRDGLAVQHAAVARAGLDRVAEGVAEIEERARPLLALVRRDDRGLDLAGAPDRLGQRRGLAREHARAVRLQPAEEGGVRDERRLHDLREPGAQLPFRQRRQRIDVADDRGRLVEGADQVLAAGMIDAGLAADGGIHLGEQRGRQLHDRDAALVGRGREARDVADHAAAEREHRPVAVDAGPDQRVDDGGDVAERLLLLAARQDADRVVAACQAFLEPRQPQRAHRVVGHDQELRRDRVAREQLARAEEPRPDQDRVGALAELHLQALHVRPRPARARCRRRPRSARGRRCGW